MDGKSVELKGALLIGRPYWRQELLFYYKLLLNDTSMYVISNVLVKLGGIKPQIH